MRTIKFKAWDGKYMEEVPDIIELWENSSYAYAAPYKPILLQFTGLLDKNGKEIYEGDILSGGHVVAFSRGRFIPHYITHYGEKWDYSDEWEDEMYTHNDIEIIGNIYEQSHLLDNTDTKV